MDQVCPRDLVNVTNFILLYAKKKALWKPNRLYTGRERDQRYNAFLINPKDQFSEWRFTTLLAAFAQEKGKKLSAWKKEVGPEQYESELNAFVLDHADQVIQMVRPDFDKVSEDARNYITQSRARPNEVLCHAREEHSDMYFKAGQRIIFYRDKLKEVDGELVAGEPLTTLWTDLPSNNLHKEGDVAFPKNKKPEALVKRMLELTTSPGDLVLDSWLGSGTTAAVAHKMGRKYIGIEKGEHARSKCIPRLLGVIEGEASGVSRAVGWTGGGGFTFLTVGEPLLGPDGRISPSVSFNALAHHLWHSETGVPGTGTFDSPMLGVHGGRAYYLLYNGILGDRRPQGGNVLTGKVLASLLATYPHSGPKVVYGEVCRRGEQELAAQGITFKQIPFDLRAR